MFHTLFCQKCHTPPKIITEPEGLGDREAPSPDFGEIRSKPCSIKRPYVTDYLPPLDLQSFRRICIIQKGHN